MKYTETLDHAPAAVELERLPDGTAWLRLHKDVVQGKTEAPEGEEGGPCWTATTAVAQLGTDRAAETVESITANLDDRSMGRTAAHDAEPAHGCGGNRPGRHCGHYDGRCRSMSIWLLLYRMKKITAAQIWERVDSGAISAEEAVKICGPRP